jgi:hypothetical protein
MLVMMLVMTLIMSFMTITYSKGTMKPPVKPDGHSPKPELRVMAFLLFSTPELQARP